jgi:hypothetical protein
MGGNSSSLPKPSTPIIKKGWLTKKVLFLLFATYFSQKRHFWSNIASALTIQMQGAVVENMKRRFFVLHSDCALRAHNFRTLLEPPPSQFPEKKFELPDFCAAGLVYYEDDSMENEKGRISIKEAKVVTAQPHSTFISILLVARFLNIA